MLHRLIGPPGGPLPSQSALNQGTALEESALAVSRALSERLPWWGLEETRARAGSASPQTSVLQEVLSLPVEWSGLYDAKFGSVR